MRRFIADASHELRTPLTAIRGFAEYYRQRGGLVQRWDRPRRGAADGRRRDEAGLTPDDLDRIMQRVEKEAARMGLLVEDLLLLARLDQQRPLARSRSTCCRWPPTRCTTPACSRPDQDHRASSSSPAPRSWSSATSRGCGRSSGT